MSAENQGISIPSFLGFLVMCAGMFLAILDIQIVASSLIEIQADLRIPADRLSYLQTIYLIAEIIAIAVSGRLARALSTRWLYTIGLDAGADVGPVCRGMDHGKSVLALAVPDQRPAGPACGDFPCRAAFHAKKKGGSLGPRPCISSNAASYILKRTPARNTRPRRS